MPHQIICFMWHISSLHSVGMFLFFLYVPLAGDELKTACVYIWLNRICMSVWGEESGSACVMILFFTWIAVFRWTYVTESIKRMAGRKDWFNVNCAFVYCNGTIRIGQHSQKRAKPSLCRGILYGDIHITSEPNASTI